MATEQNVEKFIEKIDDCLQTDINQLVSSPKWGTIDFKDVEPEIQKFFQMLNHFKTLPLELLPDAELSKLINDLTSPQNILKKIRDFSIEGQNPKGIRDQLAQQITTAVDTFYTTAHLWIPYLAYQKGDVQKNIESLNSSVKEASSVLDETKEEVEKKKQEIDSVVLAAKEASATVGVSHFSANFEEEANKLKDSAFWWLVATGVLATITLAGTILLYYILPIPNDASTAQIIQILSTKVILITVFFTATLWAGRMYKATMHQMTLNKHRANSLRTFQAFTKASNEVSTRDAVLLETTKSIFSVVPSGYLDNEQSGGGKNTNVIEVIKSSASVARKVEQ